MKKHKVIAVYPGRFQLPHKGHKFVYDYLKMRFRDVFIASSDKVELPKSPFRFYEKKELLKTAGIPATRIIQTKQPQIPKEITSKFPDDSILVIAAGQKSQDEEQRYNFSPKKDGSPSYFQPYEENKDNLKPLTEHAYIILVPTKHFTIMGKTAKSASEMRALYKSLDHEQQQRFIKDLYGSYSPKIHTILAKLDNI